jgi:trigger factor
VKEERLPDPDDDFAQQVGEGFTGMDALRDRLRGDIRERAQSVAEDKYREDALTALVENAAKIEFPPVLVDREIDHFLHDQARNSGMELERYLKLVGKTPDAIREELTPSATERVKRSLALSRLAEDEKIELEDSGIDAEIASMVAQASAGNDEQAQQYRQMFQSPEARASLGRSLLTRKTMERLVEIAGQADGARASAKKSESPGKKKTKAGSTSGKGKEE